MKTWMNVATVLINAIRMLLVLTPMDLMRVSVTKDILERDISVLILTNVIVQIHAVNMHPVLTMKALTVAIVR